MNLQIGAGLAVLAIALLGLSLLLRRAGGLPGGEIVYRDAGDEPALLRSETYALVGRPDYILRTRRGLVPVEYKPSRAGREPYRSDVLQLAAYCLLIEETGQRFAGYGVLCTGSFTRRIPFTPALRSELLAAVDDIRSLSDAGDAPPNHHSDARCRTCSCRQACEGLVRNHGCGATA